jgi:tetratricopeptide (TPR) repeat protein
MIQLNSKEISSWFLSFVLALVVFTSSAQDFKRQYRSAKDMFAAGKYSEAMIEFKALTIYDKNNPFTEYASYYYAMSAYRLGYGSVAKDMLLHIKKMYPQWDQLDEVNYLLSKIYFDQREYFQARSIMDEIKNPAFVSDLQNLKRLYLAQIEDPETLRMMLEDHPEDVEVAKILVRRLGQQEYHLQDTLLINSLVTKYGLTKSELVSRAAIRPIKKEVIRVALVLPFLASTLDPSPVRKRNQLILELYQGMKLASDSLAKMGIQLSLYAYDNERNLESTRKILREKELKGVDLMVGPFFSEEAKPVLDFSLANKISVVINPLSNNSDFVKNNPYSFLFQPSHETIGRTAAELAAVKAKKKNCFVYYGDTPKDSVMAANFIARAQELDFKVLFSQRVSNENSGSILSKLATATEFDEWKNPLQFSIKKDSIGCIFVASSNELIYSKVINSVETRKDSVLLIGQESWLDEGSVDFAKYDRINIVLASPNFRSLANPSLLDFRKRYMNRHGVLPSEYAASGFEFIMVTGQMMHRYGVNFLQTTRASDFMPGTLGAGMSISAQHDNLVVPFIALKGGQLVRVN